MPRESSITQAQVDAAADAVKAEGGRPTSRNLRERLGTGSMGTLHRMLQHWQDSQARQVETTLTLPPAMQRSLLNFLAQEIAAAKAGLEASLAESRQAATDLATENERQGAQIESQTTALADLATENATQRGRIEQLDAETVRTKHEAAMQVEAAKAHDHSEQQAREAAQVALAKAELRLEALPRLEDESSRRQTALDAERLARTDAERLAATAEVKAAGLADRLADALAQNKKTADQNERLVAELVQLRSELKEASLAVHEAQRKVDSLQAELASERNEPRIPTSTPRTARAKLSAGT
jgi:DNA repair exonuclease SbcCD ATPase subunit